MRAFIEYLNRWRAEGQRYVLVRAVNVVGFGAGQYDNALIVNERDERCGAILRGLADAQIGSIHGPIGLDLGGRNPAETAMAICAEGLAVRSGRSIPELRDSSGSINR